VLSTTPPSRQPSRPAGSEQQRTISLTRRELEVLQLLTEGGTNSEIAKRLHISPKTTKNHLAAIYAKLGVANRMQAVTRAVAMGLVTLSG
jgi:DNA-binding NarL/FixJ family response regulator